MLVGILHFAFNGLLDVSFSGVVTQGSFVTLITGILLLLTGACTILAPILGYSPFPIAKRLGSYYSPAVVIPWFVVHGIICLFMT